MTQELEESCSKAIILLDNEPMLSLLLLSAIRTGLLLTHVEWTFVEIATCERYESKRTIRICRHIVAGTQYLQGEVYSDT